MAVAVWRRRHRTASRPRDDRHGLEDDRRPSRRQRHATVTVSNKGKGGAGGVHVLISLSPNAITKGAAVASRGPGCTGVTVIDCNMGSIGSGATATVQLR